MLHKRSSKDLSGSAAMPGPSYMSKDQMGSYLNGLRSNRSIRPTGSRPYLKNTTGNRGASAATNVNEGLVSRKSSVQMARERYERETPALNIKKRESNIGQPERSQSALSQARRSEHHGGRPLVQAPESTQSEHTSSIEAAQMRQANGEYVENGSRWMERQEASSLRQALEDMDLRTEEEIHDAAQKEASDLVWNHQNPDAPYAYPQTRHSYREHLRKGSHVRSLSSNQGSNSSNSSGSRVSSGSSASSAPQTEAKPQLPEQREQSDTRSRSASPERRTRVSFAVAEDGPPQERTKWRNYWPRHRSLSRDRKHKQPEVQDRIFEEPEEKAEDGNERGSSDHSFTPAPLQIKSRNRQRQKAPEIASNARNYTRDSKYNNHDIHKNEPSQSRNGGYRVNALPTTSPDSTSESGSQERTELKERGNDIEIRGDDIRQATSMRRRDRSPNLPTPAMVSDKPGRPIVSFDREWKSREKHMEPERMEVKDPAVNDHSDSDLYAGSDSSVPVMPVPSINVSCSDLDATEGQTASVPGVPSISVQTDDEPQSRRAETGSAPKRPLPAPRSTQSNGVSRFSSGPSIRESSERRTNAVCSYCQQMIAGRIVNAGGERFHPNCFRCYHCGEGLECVAFYPETDGERGKRMEQEQQEYGSVDAVPRFYCHLDFHELFSPRCKSCKTPIEGEVVVACGAEWHVGHFFCAECGDPFDPTTPFVEKDGYAWCVDCHTKRYSTKCKRCRRPVTEMVVKALDAEWHAECFRCTECDGPFENGRYFVRADDEDPVCVKCEERRLKA